MGKPHQILRDLPEIQNFFYRFDDLLKEINTLDELKVKTAREVWLLCRYGAGFKTLTQLMIKQSWSFRDCTMATMRAFLQDDLDKLNFACSSEDTTRLKLALQRADITSFEILKRLSARDLKTSARNIATVRVKQLKQALTKLGISLLPG